MSLEITTTENLSEAQARRLILQNRERYLEALRKHTKHNPDRYFQSRDGVEEYDYDPEGSSCTNGVAFLALGYRSTSEIPYEFTTRSFGYVVQVNLGITQDDFERMNDLNRRHSIGWLTEYIEQELFRLLVGEVVLFSESDRKYLRVIPKGFTYEKPNGAINRYYCPECGEWFCPMLIETTTRRSHVNRHMKDGGFTNQDDGTARYHGGWAYQYTTEPAHDPDGDLIPDVVERKFSCRECNAVLSDAFTEDLMTARVINSL